MTESIVDVCTTRPKRWHWRRIAIAMAGACIALAEFGSGQFAQGQQPVVIAAPQPPILPPMEPEIFPPDKAESVLSLPDLEKMALASNPSVARASAMVGAARGHWIQVGLPPNPSIGYDGQQLGIGLQVSGLQLGVEAE